MNNYNINQNSNYNQESQPKKNKKGIIIATIAIVCLIGAFSGSNDTVSTTENANIKTQEVTSEVIAETQEPEINEETQEPQTEQEKIIQTLTDRITSEYWQTDIDNITVNANLGTEEVDDYIALVRLTWNKKNSEDTSKEMINMYSRDLAAYIAATNSRIQEIVIFWEIPYLDMNAKISYERQNGYMYESDAMWL